MRAVVALAALAGAVALVGRPVAPPRAAAVRGPAGTIPNADATMTLFAGGGDGDKKRQRWPVSRFVSTLRFFGKTPRLPLPFLKRRKPVATAVNRPMSAGSVVMVVGATGGVGKRVVQRLLDEGTTVRALARNGPKALAMLAPDAARRLGSDALGSGRVVEVSSELQLVQADIADPASLTPEMFQDVEQVVIASAAIVQPREGDGPNREKYYQGLKFFEPETVDRPADVDFEGTRNVVKAAVRFGATAGVSAPLYGGVRDASAWADWGSLDDVVMGGVSKSALSPATAVEDPAAPTGFVPAGVFAGEVSTSNNGGFTSVRTRNFEPPLDLSDFDGIRLRVRGDGKRYKLMVRDGAGWDSECFCTSFDTSTAGEWTDVHARFDDMRPVKRAMTIPGGRLLDTRRVYSLQITLSKFEYDGDLNPAFSAGPFELAIAEVAAFRAAPAGEAAVPRIAYVSSAGVERPGRPGLDLEKEPPAVRMNDMLGGILTNKLRGEDAVRTSGVPYVVVRPCALTEEPPGAEIIVAQGDEIKGKISRDDVADLIAGALRSPSAVNRTFEVKSNLAFADKAPEGVDVRGRDFTPLFDALAEDSDLVRAPPAEAEAPAKGASTSSA